jgi:uncharacterized membrane protein YfcA
MYLLTIFLASLMGFVMGFLGSGGSILTVPTLVYVLGFDPKEAIPLSLVIVGLTAAMGFVQRLRQKMVDLTAGLFFGFTGIVGTFTGSRLSKLFTGAEQMILFATVMMTAALFMAWRGLKKSAPTPSDPGKISYPLAILLGGLVGTLTGLVGVGGGFLIVPALTSVGLAVPIAMGTSLMVIALNCLSGILSYTGQANIAWRTAALFIFFSGSASLIGARLAKNVDGKKMSLAFAIFLFLLGIAILYKNREVFL